MKDADAAFKEGDWEKAEILYTIAIEEAEAGGGDGELIEKSLSGLARSYQKQGKHRDVEPVLWLALVVRLGELGKTDATVADELSKLAPVLLETGRVTLAGVALTESIKIRDRSGQREGPKTLDDLREYAKVLRMEGRDEEADRQDARARAIMACYN